MEVDTTVVTVGDRILLTVSVDHPSGSRVVWPDSLTLALAPFEVLEAHATAPASRGESTRSSLILALAAFELGDLEIPSFDLEVVAQDGGTTALSTNRFGIQVLTVGLDEGGDIRDIRGPLGIPVGLVQVSVLFLGMILAVAVAWILFRRFWRKGGEAIAGAPASPSLPPHQLALDALARIERSSLLERGQVKEYHIAVSEVLRIYIGGQFQVPALEMTTMDVMPGLEESGIPAGVLDGFGDFLHRCDLVKFAKYRPESDDSLALLALGRRLVEDTIPVSAQAEETLVPPPEGQALPDEEGQEAKT
jgi:hypothetical protein